ncbi:MAG TPA: DUF2339 domain-containing protein, partial [Sphingomicrobium sp.]|nr:DUF2339 domain-containing protein [Sphingomicrobium sp.]
MFEVLVLVAVVVVLAQFNKRVSQLEREVADLNAYSAAQRPAPVEQGPRPEPPIAPVEAPAGVQADALEAEPLRIEPAEPEILYAELRSSEPAEDAIAAEPVESVVAHDAATELDKPSPSSFSFEELFGRKLPIWAGGITLAVAGMLIVKLSIEAGLLSPPVRVIMGSIFGFALIGAAELALRQEERVRDDRVRQALSGAGIASLYASVLIASNLYHLISPLPAMLGMAAVTALALGLSLRFGAPSALLGLAGGLAAPALIGSDEPNIALLSLYLALAVGGLCTLSRGQRWAWLGISALVGGFGWGLLLMLGGALSVPDTISVGLYLMLLGVALPMLGFAGDWQARLRLITAIAAAAQMAALVATGGFAMLNWGLFGLISLAMLWLASRDPSLALLPPVGLMIVLLLLGVWPDPLQDHFALVMAGAGLIYGLPALWRLWRANGSIVEAAEIAAISLAGLWLPLYHFYGADGFAPERPTDVRYGLLAIAVALIAAVAAALGWKHAERRDDARFAILAISAGLLLSFAAGFLLPDWLEGDAIAAVGLVLLILGQRAEDKRFELICWLFAAAGLASNGFEEPWGIEPPWQDAMQWGFLAAAYAAFAWKARFRYGRLAAQFLAPMLLCLALVPLVQDRFEPLIAPVLLLALAAAPLRLAPAIWSAAVMIAAWAVEPVGRWLGAGGNSLFGIPIFVDAVPGPEDALLKLLIPAASIGISLWLARARLVRYERIGGLALGSLLGAIAVHSLYKLIFAIGSDRPFVTYGLAERTLWEVLLLISAGVCWRLRKETAGLVFLGAAGGHVMVYTLLLHNPLWAEQAVGALPLINLLVPAYAVPAAILWAVDRISSVRRLVPDRAI